jgi:hypothetical protein
MNTFALKLLAIVFMLIDHIGVILVSQTDNWNLYLLCRGLGRLAFPIFAFLLVEGFYRTSNVKKYMERLGLFALISEIPFDIAFYQVRYGSTIWQDLFQNSGGRFNTDPLEMVIHRLFEHQNIFFTLFLGLLLMYYLKQVERKFKNQAVLCNVWEALLVICFSALAYLIKCDYGMAGVLVILAFYVFRGSKLLQSVALFIITISLLCNVKYFLTTGDIINIIGLLATLAMLPISFYNDKKGKDVKYLFYIFYPGHLILLYLLTLFISWKVS